MKRLLGIIIIITALVGALIGIGGVILGRQAVDGIAQSIDDTMPLVLESLAAVEDSLVLAKNTIGEVNTALDNTGTLTVDLSKSIADAAPAVDQIVAVTGEDIPAGIEAFQASIPNLENVAATIDQTLQTLADFKIETRILTFPLEFDLGIEYDPEAPFDESIAQIGTSMEGVPEQMRLLSTELEVTSENLIVLSDDILALAGDVNNINEQLTELPPLMDRYISIINQLESNLIQLQQTLTSQFGNLKLVITIVMVWFILTQLAPLYIGWELVSGKRDARDQSADTTTSDEPEVVSMASYEPIEPVESEPVATASAESEPVEKAADDDVAA
ncbi:MAG: hypothetical protein M9928_07345 [Anaerolineae bacterium]|nr:hypothetical protein [Anaerolineae bacterium]MCO5204829.1 hypothetical protein [Anaerolineae bacterium]